MIYGHPSSTLTPSSYKLVISGQNDYTQVYPEDDWMREMGPSARVWSVYNDETDFIDAEIVEGYLSTADVLLVFVSTSLNHL